MRTIWNKLNNMNMRIHTKNTLFLTLMVTLCGMAGGLIWMILGRHFCMGLLWFLCYIGYPAVFIGLIGGTLFLYKHEFV